MRKNPKWLPECVVCGEERPTWQVLQFSSYDADLAALTDGYLPICGRCLPRCPTCGAPVPTAAADQRVAEINQAGRVTARWFFEPCLGPDHDRPAIETYPRDPRLPIYGPPAPPRETPGYSFLIARLNHVGIGDYVTVDGEAGVGRIRYIQSSRLGGGIWVTVDYPDGRSFAKRAPDVHPVGASEVGREVPTSTAVETTSTKDVAGDPLDVISEGIDRSFGDGYLSTVLSEAIAEGIETLCAADGSLEAAEVACLLVSCGLGDELALSLIEASDRDERGYVISEAFDADPYELDCVIEELVGTVEGIGGCDSSSFAVMTAGHLTTNVLVRGDEFTTFDTGSEEGFEFYCMTGRRHVADDPGFRQTRLDVARQTDGLRPGVWISDARELDDELRALTWLGYDFTEAVERVGIDDLVDEWAPGLVTSAGLNEEAAGTGAVDPRRFGAGYK